MGGILASGFMYIEKLSLAAASTVARAKVL